MAVDSNAKYRKRSEYLDKQVKSSIDFIVYMRKQGRGQRGGK